MIITKFKLKRLADPIDNMVDQWEIDVITKPTWFDKIFRGKTTQEKFTMTGSCLTWKINGIQANYFWRLWAFNIINKRIKNSGRFTYVNSRINRKKDKNCCKDG